MVNRKAVFPWLFPLKFDCQHSWAVVYTYLSLFEMMIHNFEPFT